METYMNVHDLSDQVFISRHGFQLILYGRDPAKGATLYECGRRVCNIFVEEGMYTGEFSMDTRIIEGKVPQAILSGRGICSLWPCM